MSCECCEWLTVQEFAAAARLGEKRVYQLIAEGLPHTRKTGRIRLRMSDYSAWMESGLTAQTG